MDGSQFVENFIAIIVLTGFFYAVLYVVFFSILEVLRSYTDHIENMTLWYNVSRIICLVGAFIISSTLLF
jgi:hypothetical protein